MLEKPDYKQFNLMYNINNKGLLTEMDVLITKPIKLNRTKVVLTYGRVIPVLLYQQKCCAK